MIAMAATDPAKDAIGLRWVAIGPALGLLLGAVDSIVNHVPVWLGEVGTARAERGGWSQVSEFASLILDAGWAWAAAAVLAGRLVGRHRSLVAAALSGASTLVFATIAYYGTDIVFDGDDLWNTTTRYWLTGSVVLGPVLGAAGALSRGPGPVGVLAALLVPAGAALQMALLPPPRESLMAEPVRLTVWTAAATATVLILATAGSRRADRTGRPAARNGYPTSPGRWSGRGR
jgi:hypothetical protein